MVNNYDWTGDLSTIDFLRDVGKHFPVNRMLARDVVRRRLEAGISFTEFSYVLLQSMDFLNLYRDHGVTLQFGGSRPVGQHHRRRRADPARGARRPAHAFATPLITKADGTKYGKTEGDALWLDPEMIRPYAFYQFWLNVDDRESASCCGLHLPSPRGDRGAGERRPPRSRSPAPRRGRSPSERHHAGARRGRDPAGDRGHPGALRSRLARVALRGDPRRGPAEAGLTRVPRRVNARRADEGVRPGAGMGEARRTIAEGGAYVNNERVSNPDDPCAVRTTAWPSWPCCAAARRPSPAWRSFDAARPGDLIGGPGGGLLEPVVMR